MCWFPLFVRIGDFLTLPYMNELTKLWDKNLIAFAKEKNSLNHISQAGASILGGMGGTRPPQFLDWGNEYLIVPPIFFICSMKFNSTLFSVYCGHCLSLSILLNIIQIQTRSHMLTQSCFFSNFLRCY